MCIIVFAKDRVEVLNLNQIKLKVNETYKKAEKVTTISKRSNGEGVV